MTNSHRLTKNEKRRLREKNKNSSKTEVSKNLTLDTGEVESKKEVNDDLVVDIEYVSADYEKSNGNDPFLFLQFRDVFQKFLKPEELLGNSENSVAGDQKSSTLDGTESKENNGESKDSVVKLSKKKKKLLTRLSVAELKQLVNRPDVVEAHDVTSSDPHFLVYLKAYRGTVPVPRHWCHKRKYLTGKRGIEKAPFQLPEFIADTGIAKIRETVLEQEAMKKSKQKARDRVKPKMGKIDIDYQVLHDAFFKYQTKPKLTNFGDLYYEGKEFEVHMKDKKHGVLSAELKEALAMTEPTSPPPWLINMQRYGLPPSYPTTLIPGLNAPLPPGASYGFQPGGWGKPPVDEFGRPLYGDVFGTSLAEDDAMMNGVDKTKRWGVSIEVAVDDAEDDDEGETDADESGILTKGELRKGRKGASSDSVSGMDTPNTADGTASVVTSGTETPDTTIDLRKRAGTDTPESGYSNYNIKSGLGTGIVKELYQVIPEKQVTGSAVTGQIFGSDRTYLLPNKSDVQISINPDELEEMFHNKEKLKDVHDSKVSQSMNEFGSNSGLESEDPNKVTGKKRRVESNTAAKKYKEFKF